MEPPGGEILNTSHLEATPLQKFWVDRKNDQRIIVI